MQLAQCGEQCSAGRVAAACPRLGGAELCAAWQPACQLARSLQRCSVSTRISERERERERERDFEELRKKNGERGLERGSDGAHFLL